MILETHVCADWSGTKKGEKNKQKYKVSQNCQELIDWCYKLTFLFCRNALSALHAELNSRSFIRCSRNIACNSEKKYTSKVNVKNIVNDEKTSSRLEEGRDVETVEAIETDQ